MSLFSMLSLSLLEPDGSNSSFDEKVESARPAPDHQVYSVSVDYCLQVDGNIELQST